MGRSMRSAFTLPRWARLSSSTRCLMATWALACRCCILQPPQAPACSPKCGQPGCTRCELSRRISRSVACSHWFFLRTTSTSACSPGSAPSMKTTLPSLLRATPWASMSSDSTVSHSSLSVMCELSLEPSDGRGAVAVRAVRRQKRRPARPGGLSGTSARPPSKQRAAQGGPVVWLRGRQAPGCAQRGGSTLAGSIGRPWRRTSKCSCTRSASDEPISAIFWPRRTAWSSFTSRIWLWA